MSSTTGIVDLIVAHGDKYLLNIATTAEFVSMVASALETMASHIAVIEELVSRQTPVLTVIDTNHIITQMKKARTLIRISLKIMGVVEKRYLKMGDEEGGALPETISHLPLSHEQSEALKAGLDSAVDFSERLSAGVDALAQKLGQAAGMV